MKFEAKKEYRVKEILKFLELNDDVIYNSLGSSIVGESFIVLRRYGKIIYSFTCINADLPVNAMYMCTVANASKI